MQEKNDAGLRFIAKCLSSTCGDISGTDCGLARQLSKREGIPILATLRGRFLIKKRLWIVLGIALASSLVFGTFAKDTRADDESVIRRANANWAAAVRLQSVDGWMNDYSEDALVLPPHAGKIVSKGELRSSAKALFELHNLYLSWEPSKVEFARSGELAYAYADYEMSWTTASGDNVKGKGANLQIWKKERGKVWKCMLNFWRPSVPTATSIPEKPSIPPLN